MHELMNAAKYTLFGLEHSPYTDEEGSTMLGRVSRYSAFLRSLLNAALHLSLFAQLPLNTRVHLITRCVLFRLNYKVHS